MDLNLNKTQVVIGVIGIFLAAVGIYYARKQIAASNAAAAANSPTATLQPQTIFAGSGGGGTYNGGATVPVATPTFTGGTLDQSQLGDTSNAAVLAVLGQQISDNFNIGMVNAMTMAATPVLARGNDLQDRVGGTLTLDYTGSAGMPSASGSTTGLSTVGQMSAHLSETVPDHIAAPPPPPIILPQPVNIDQRDESSGCFITTAVCQYKGLSDDCEMLRDFRRFRDLKVSDTDRAEYYKIAPALVESINKKENAAEIWEAIYSHYLCPAHAFIKEHNYEMAYSTYRRLVGYCVHVAG